MSQWEKVCGVDDLQTDSGILCLIGDKQIALFYMPAAESRVFAIDNYDPLGKANVLSRGIIGDINGEPVVASPLYKEHYNLNTGYCLEDENISVKAYEARIVGELVEVKV